MRLSNLLTGAFIASTLFSACTTDDIAIPKSELYAREFIKKFGVIDPTRDLGSAVHTSVNVVTTKPTDVKVYADISGQRYLFAEGRKISGTTQLTFDLPKGVNEVIVDIDGREIKTPLGGSVSAPKTGRAIWEKKDPVVEITRTDYRGLTDEGVTAFKNYLPEEEDNLGQVTQNFSFVANGDFTIYPTYWQTRGYNTLGIYYIDESTNEMVLIPFYTNKILPIDGTKGNLLYTTGDPYAEDLVPAKDNIPLIDPNRPLDAAYALTADKSKTLDPIEYNNRGLTSFLDFTDDDWFVFKRRWTLKQKEATEYFFNTTPFSEHFDIKYIVDAYWNYGQKYDMFISGIECEAADENHVNITSLSMGPLNEWVYPGNNGNDSHPGGNVTGWKSRGIHIHIEPGTKFGMYVRSWIPEDEKPENGSIPKPSIDNVDIVRLPLDENGMPKPDQYRRFYSEAKYNQNVNYSNVFGATYMYEAPTGTYRVLGFEDWDNFVHDLNDMMFFITSDDPLNIPDVKDEDKRSEPYQWLIAAEDLSGTYDWDFNDAVFSVTAVHVVDGEDNNKKTTEIRVEPLAAGGTMPIYIMFNGEILDVLSEKGAELSSGVQHYQIGGELHQWLGGYYRSPINVKEDVQTAKGAPIAFVVDGEWSIAQHLDNPTWTEAIEYKGMGGFYVLVNQNNTLPAVAPGKVHIFEGDLNSDENIHVVRPPKAFDKKDDVVVSPEMLCLKNTWCWPKEEAGIHEVYYQFEKWLGGDNADWYGDEALFDSSRIVRRK